MYTIPVDELSISRMENFRKACREAMLARAQDKSIAKYMNELTFRDVLPADDMGAGLAVGGTGYTNNIYLTGAVAANVWTLVYDTGAVQQLANTKILGIYKIYDLSVNPLITSVRFRKGNTGATTLGVTQVEQFFMGKLTPECYLSEPIIYSPQDWMFIECLASAAIGAVGERLAFGAYVAEPVGGTVS